MPLLPRALARLLSDQSEVGHAKAGPEPGPGERGAGPSSEGGEEQFVDGGLGGGGSDDVPATTGGGASSSAGGGAGAKRDVVQLWRRLNEEGRTRYTHLSHAHARKHSLTHAQSPPLPLGGPARRAPERGRGGRRSTPRLARLVLLLLLPPVALPLETAAPLASKGAAPARPARRSDTRRNHALIGL